MTRREQIRFTAEEFLKSHHADLSLPVPVEDILEVGLRVEVRPLPGLYKLFARNGILMSSGKVIAVDNDDFESNQTRLRFTLAHELGHILLHAEHVKDVSLEDAAQAWKQYSGIEPEALDRMERDASYFAGHLLVPQSRLLEELDKAKKKLLEKHGIDITGKGADVREVVAKAIADPFEVSPNVVRFRLEEEGLP